MVHQIRPVWWACVQYSVHDSALLCLGLSEVSLGADLERSGSWPVRWDPAETSLTEERCSITLGSKINQKHF